MTGARGSGGPAEAGRAAHASRATEPSRAGGTAVARFPLPSPIDLPRTLAPLGHGRDDPTIRFAPGGIWIARATTTGPATLRLAAEPGELVAEAWGPGAQLAIEAAPGLAGLLDDPSALVPQHPLIRDLARRFAALRLPRTGQLLAALIPAVTEQKVTAIEAHAAYGALVRRLGRAAPGPVALLLPPDAADLAALPYFDFHPLGLERRRAELLRRIGREGPRIESWTALEPAEARARLQTIGGIGPWTAAEATRLAFGDPDAVSLGDAHIPDMVSWALAGNPAPTTVGCSSCWRPMPASAPAWSACWRSPGSRSLASDRGSRLAGSPGSRPAEARGERPEHRAAGPLDGRKRPRC
jgi:3-methyladenine DNA glycosylase/8-oxoguanine DNA glycosylase